MMITRTPRALSRASIRSLSTTTLTRPTILPRLAQTTLQSRLKSTIVERSPLHSVPSKAERVGKPAVDTNKGKVWDSAYEAVQDIKPGSFVLSSGTSLDTRRQEGVVLICRFRIMWNCGDYHQGFAGYSTYQ